MLNDFLSERSTNSFFLHIKNVPVVENMDEILKLYMENESNAQEVNIKFNCSKSEALVEYIESPKNMHQVIDCIKNRQLLKNTMSAEPATFKKRLIIKNLRGIVDSSEELQIYLEQKDLRPVCNSLNYEVKVQFDAENFIAIAILPPNADIDKYLNEGKNYIDQNVIIEKCDYFTNLSDLTKVKSKQTQMCVKSSMTEPKTPCTDKSFKHITANKDGMGFEDTTSNNEGASSYRGNPRDNRRKNKSGKNIHKIPSEKIDVQGNSDDKEYNDASFNQKSSQKLNQKSNLLNIHENRKKYSQMQHSLNFDQTNYHAQTDPNLKPSLTNNKFNRGRGRINHKQNKNNQICHDKYNPLHGDNKFSPSLCNQELTLDYVKQVNESRTSRNPFRDNHNLHRSYSQSSLNSNASEFSLAPNLMDLNLENKLKIGFKTEIINVTNEIRNEKCLFLISLSKSLSRPNCRFFVDKIKHEVMLRGPEKDVNIMKKEIIAAINNTAYTRLTLPNNMFNCLISRRGLTKMKELMINLEINARIIFQLGSNILQVFGENPIVSAKAADAILSAIQADAIKLTPEMLTYLKTEAWLKFNKYIEGNFLVISDVDFNTRKLSITGFSEDFKIAMTSIKNELESCSDNKVSDSIDCPVLSYRYIKIHHPYLLNNQVRFDNTDNVLSLSGTKDEVEIIKTRFDTILNSLKSEDFCFMGLGEHSLGKKDSPQRLMLEQMEEQYICAIGFAKNREVENSLKFSIIYENDNFLQKGNIKSKLSELCDSLIYKRTILIDRIFLKQLVPENFSSTKAKVTYDDINNKICISGEAVEVEQIHSNIIEILNILKGNC